MTDPSFLLLGTVLALLKERTARVQFQKVLQNYASTVIEGPLYDLEVDCQPDFMFQNPGILLSSGSQRQFTKILKMRYTYPHRKSTFVNLERVCDMIAE